MSVGVPVKAELLHWASERAGHDLDAMAARFPKLKIHDWVTGAKQPTLKQLEAFANATHTPIGYFFLPAPPVIEVPLPDLRTMAGDRRGRPSPNMLDAIYLCQQRQEWYRDYAKQNGEDPLPFVGSARLEDDVVETADTIRKTIRFDLALRNGLPTWTEALRYFIARADEAGILVMVSGVVGNNTSRPLDPEEFRGFAIADDLAPLVFINAADTKAGQMFTLAHELAHIWLGRSALSDARAGDVPEHRVERWCNAVAAELLVPLSEFRKHYDPGHELRTELDRLARRFKVSTLVILRRMHDAGGLTRSELWEEHEKEVARLRRVSKSSGGDFYLTLGARASKRLARALVVSTLEGRTLYRDAFRLLGISTQETFDHIAKRLGGM